MLRREFIKYLTAGAAGEFILPATMASAATGLNVVIIGGGMAGATAAKYLRVWAKKLALDSLVSVTIIDKSDKYVSNIMSNMVLTGEKTLTNLTYTYANLTTKYGVKFIKATVSSVDPATGWVYGKLNNTGSDILLNATPFNRLILATGVTFDYQDGLTDFTLNVLGSVYSTATDAIPHAWQAGTQTTLLRNQLVNMKAGNHVAITIPPGPYRCPPGPYERACVLADWLRVKKPGSKLYLLDYGQTDDARPSVEPTNFGYAFSNIHKNLVYIQNARLADVTASLSGTTKLKTLSITPASGATKNAVNALTAPQSVTVEVANVIPKMQAGSLTRSILGGRWADVDEKTYKSKDARYPNVYVIGDSISSANQPKAGHIGSQQAKVCADAILREFSNVALYDAPVTNSACFTPVTTSLNSQYGAMASWLTATFRYALDPNPLDNKYRMLKVSTNIESPGNPSKDNFESMGKWFTSLMQDVYS